MMTASSKPTFVAKMRHAGHLVKNSVPGPRRFSRGTSNSLTGRGISGICIPPISRVSSPVSSRCQTGRCGRVPLAAAGVGALLRAASSEIKTPSGRSFVGDAFFVVGIKAAFKHASPHFRLEMVVKPRSREAPGGDHAGPEGIGSSPRGGFTFALTGRRQAPGRQPPER
jgi:hypothetical protein